MILPSTVISTIKHLVVRYVSTEISREETKEELSNLVITFGQNTIYSCFDAYYADLITNGKFSDNVEIKEKKCTCGAAYTSTPKFHYEWCDLKQGV